MRHEKQIDWAGRIFCLFLVFWLCSCSAAKKGYTKTQYSKDTTSVSEKDTASKSTDTGTTTKKVDSAGTKTTTTTTTTDEEDTDDFEIDITYGPKDSGKPVGPVTPVVVVIGDDTTTVTGGTNPTGVTIKGSKKKKKTDSTGTTTTETATVAKADSSFYAKTDSSGKKEKDSAHAQINANSIDKSVKRWSIGVPWYVWLILIAGGFIVWRYRLWRRKKVESTRPVINYTTYQPPPPPDNSQHN